VIYSLAIDCNTINKHKMTDDNFDKAKKNREKLDLIEAQRRIIQNSKCIVFAAENGDEFTETDPDVLASCRSVILPHYESQRIELEKEFKEL